MADGGRVAVDFAGSAVGRRLSLCAELAQMKRGDAPAVTGAKLRPRAHALLRLLVPGELGPGRPSDVLYSRAEAVRLFGEAIEAASGGSDAAKVRTALMLRDMRQMADRAMDVGPGLRKPLIDFPAVPADFLRRDPGMLDNEDSAAMPVLNEAKALGTLPDGLVAGIEAALRDNPLTPITEADVKREHPELYGQFIESQARQREQLEVARKSEDADEANKYMRLHEEMDRLRSALQEAGARMGEARKAAVGASVQGYMDAVIEEGGVTGDMAASWADSNVVITKRAAARLKKLGYAPAQVVKDAAEFYRLARGRIEKVVIDSVGDRRANAVGIADHGTAGRINLGSWFNRQVLWHELGHHVEADPIAAAAARLFIRLRSKDGGKLHALRKLTGHKGYGAGEVAYANGFFHPYVGKVYRHGTTEVFSMGLESFSSPHLLAQRIAVDPATFEFVIGYLRSPKTMLQRLHLSMRQTMREGSEAATEAAEAGAAAAIKREIAKIKDFVTATKLPPGFDHVWVGGIVGYLSPEVDGTVYALAPARWRHPKTGRLGKMLRLVKIAPGSTRVPMASDHFPAGQPEIARLALVAWRKTGIEPRYDFIASGQFSSEA